MKLYCQKIKDKSEYRNFYKNIVAVSMCGAKKEDIVQVMISEVETDNPTHWAYFDEEKKEFLFVFKTKTQVQMCSPNFFKTEIEEGKGRIVKVKITEIDF
jgi:hypothetical protein